MIFSKITSKFSNSIHTLLVNNSSETWFEYFGELKAYENKNLIKRGSSLSNWCNHQRQNFYKGILSKTKIELLNSIDFIWDPLEVKWQENFKKLKRFYIDNGN